MTRGLEVQILFLEVSAYVYIYLNVDRVKIGRGGHTRSVRTDDAFGKLVIKEKADFST